MADGIPTSPNDLPLFYSFFHENLKYHDASFKAQEAFFVQSGITPFYNSLNSYVSTKVTNGVTYAIDNWTPFTSKQIFFAAGAAYQVGVKKQVSRSFRNPLCPFITNTVSISRDSQSIAFNVRF
jgi:hypothetical protein